MALSFQDMAAWWDAAALDNPQSAILSGNSAWNEAEFFESGRNWIKEHFEFAQTALTQSGKLVMSGKRALDFGCGLGRMTQAIAEFYEETVGLDISLQMLEGANTHNKKPNVSFVHAANYPLPIESRSFDLVYSTIVIQHIPPPHNIAYVWHLMNAVADGGVILFDAPSETRLEILGTDGIWLLPMNLVCEIARASGLRLMALRTLGTKIHHFQYLFQRRAISS